MSEKLKRYSEAYKSYCEVVEKFAAEKIERALSDSEKKAIWNAGSIMQLEVIEQHLSHAETAEQTITALARWSKPSELRFESDFKFVIETMERLLNRSLHDSEKSKIHSSRSVIDMMRLAEQMKEVKDIQRETVFQELLTEIFV
jgi:hypothetical protein